MQAAARNAMNVILAAVFLFAMGCRGSSPFGRHVQITKNNEAELPEIDPPQQRLATTKPRESVSHSLSDSSPASATSVSASLSDEESADQIASMGSDEGNPLDRRGESTEQSDRNPSNVDGKKVSQKESTPATTASTRLPPKKKKESRSAKNSATEQASGVATEKVASAAGRVSDDGAEQSKKSVQPESASVERDAADGVGDAMGTDELLAALRDFPPELREQALRQFVAAAARSADRTDQPNQVESALANNVSQLPDLPEPKSTPSDVSPTRLAQSTRAASENEAPDVKVAAATPSDEQPVKTTDLAEADSSKVKTIADAMIDEQNPVKTASAARDDHEGLMVSHAIGDAKPATRKQAAEEETVPAKSTSDLLGQLVEQLSKPVAGESEAERNSRLIKLRHLLVLSGDPDSAVTDIEGMADAEQEYLRHQLLGLWTMIDPDGHPVSSRRFASAIPQIREAAKFAAAATDSLEVRSLAFCTEIESYGQIKSFTGNRFDAGQQVILYCEIENFTAKRLEDGFETHLKGSYDVYNEENQKIFSQVLPADQQTSANYLRDYFIAYQMHLPREIQPGTYRLQLTMEDVHGKKYGQSSVPFEIAK